MTKEKVTDKYTNAIVQEPKVVALFLFPLYIQHNAIKESKL